MADKTGPQKIVSIDILRAIAALGVYYYHNQSGATLAKYTGLSIFNYTDGFGALYAVPLFFLISGYCIHASNIRYIKSNSSLPLKDYYLRRFLRIYPPYIAALLIALTINYCTIPGYKPAGTDLLIHFFSLQGFTVAYFNTINIVLWTISIEIAFYAIYPVFYFVRFKYNLNYALALTFFVSALSIAYFMNTNLISLPQRFCVFNLWFAWCCGAFLADKKMLSADDLKQPIYLFIYAIILTAFLCLTYIPNKQFIVTDQFNILIWTAPILFLLSKEEWLRKHQNSWIVKILAAIGLSSYSLYLLHEPLIYLKNFLAHKYLPGRIQLLGVTMGVFIIPIVTWYHYYLVERPFINKKRQGKI
ncbi:MAG TPA: acyltransferase [Mucilaginibacter sp.]|jgi:peptidoglycan/LPS O-acetylase OafA/YrhL|nr:acyltransferase [Mucilaginibacter sp.]